jgi:hypothetical protein
VSRVISKTFTYDCGFDHSLTESCHGKHEIRVEAHNTSDTVSAINDGEVLFCLSDPGYHALVDAIKDLNDKWKLHPGSRDLTFDGPTTNLSECLSVSDECVKKCEAFVENAVNNHWNLKRLVKEANETLALNDAEWTAFMYTIGWWDSARTRAGEI